MIREEEERKTQFLVFLLFLGEFFGVSSEVRD